MGKKNLEELILKNPMSLKEIKKYYDIKIKDVRTMIDDKRVEGYDIQQVKAKGHNKFYINNAVKQFGNEYEVDLAPDEPFALIGDTHLGSKFADIDTLHEFYDIARDRGVNKVFHAGDMIEGMNVYRGQLNDLEVYGVDAQIDYATLNYPKKGGLETLLISGNHDLKMFEKDGIDPTKHIAANRSDITYLGQLSRRVKLGDNINLQLVHGSGGSAYARSYKSQVFLRNSPPDLHPDILAMGHFHTSYWIPEEQGTEVFNVGCFMHESDYLVRKGMYSVIGGWIVDAHGNENGIDNIKAEFLKFNRDYNARKVA